MPNVTARPYRIEDEKEIVSFLTQVFNGWPSFDVNSNQYWKWKYQKNPIKCNYNVVAESDGKIVGCMHGIPQSACAPWVSLIVLKQVIAYN